MTKIFLLAGQSNMHGAGVTDELPETLRRVPQNMRLFEQGEERDLLWRDNFGPELGFARKAGSLFTGEQVFLCKTAVGGSNLYYDWNPHPVEKPEEDDYRGPLFPRLFDELEKVKEIVESERREWEVCGMLWMQGERDSVFEFMAEAYEDNLRELISETRERVADSELPVIIGEIAPRQYNLAEQRFGHAYRSTVQMAQREVARTESQVDRVRTMDLPQFDNLHYTTGGQLELGRRFADALPSLLS